MKVPENREAITLDWLNTIFKPYGIRVHEYKFTGNTGVGRGFMGTLEQMELEISRYSDNSGKSSVPDSPAEETRTSSSTEKLHIILKTLPDDPFRKSYAANDGFSSREVSMYTDVFPRFEKFLDNRQVPPANRCRFPICYYGAEEGIGDTYKYILVLENLTAPNTGLSLWTGGFTKPLPWLSATAVIRQIARFHATGIAYKIENNVDSYANLFPKLNHVASDAFQMMWDKGFQVAKEVIEATVDVKDIPEGIYEQLDKLKEDKELLLRWFLSPSMFSGDKATIAHHDLHSNNLVLSTDHCRAVLFDYQASCAFNPMKDLSFFLILNCALEDSTVNLARALQLYHDEFAQTMDAIKTDFKYPLDAITKDYDWYLSFSIAHVLTGAPIWITGEQSTVESRRRFAMVVIDAYKRGVLKFPTFELK